jgi:hypothetical protein
MWGEHPAWQKTTVGLLNLYCGYNDRHWSSVYVVHSTTEIIYVGHTKTGVRNRLAQHLTWGCGIHGRSDLGRFLNENHDRDLMITIIWCYNFSGLKLEADLIWSLKPVFNKVGKKQRIDPLKRRRAEFEKNNQPEMEATPDSFGWITCPNCKKRFCTLYGSYWWKSCRGKGYHTTCGQKIKLVTSSRA